MYQNIAVAYDGSDGSRLAFDKAIEFKKLLPDVKMTIIYVNEQFHESMGLMESGGAAAPRVVSANVDSTYAQFMPPDMESGPQRRTNDYVDTSIEFSKHMHNSIHQQLDSKGVEADVLALEGSAGKTIPAFIEEQNVDLLIIGNSGKSGLQKFFVGSVSRKLIKESSCSVLVVK
ncbi:universal stress protein [Planococcus sp. 1R117A]|uniref:universal stress protein n=1 Tax=Planococcus sp. 1R117A TaxID=3447020 RepID=UPI003EDCA134